MLAILMCMLIITVISYACYPYVYAYYYHC